MVGYTNVRKSLEEMHEGETAVIVGVPLTNSLENKSEIKFDVANSMIHQCRHLPSQIQDYFSGFAMVANVYKDEVFRLPSMPMCCKVEYADRFAVSYDDILAAFFTSFKYSEKWPLWLPNAAYTARKYPVKPEPVRTLNNRFPVGVPFIAYITFDRERALEVRDSVDEIDIQVKQSNTSKVPRRQLDRNCLIGAFFNGLINYTDGYIIAVLRKALEAYRQRNFPDDPVFDPVNGRMPKAQYLLAYKDYEKGGGN